MVTAILRYGAPAWGDALNAKHNLQKVTSVYRLICLRVCSAYRTTSADAACVLGNMIPIGLLVQEDTRCYEQRGVGGARATARVATMAQWQRSWDDSAKGRWTHRMIPNLERWVLRKHGEINFYLTQVLSGHGCFRQYLHRFGHATSPNCPSCTDTVETVEHVVFVCPRFQDSRNTLLLACGSDTSPDNLVDRMCLSEDAWSAASRAITQIMLKLQQKWRTKQRAQGQS